ncbi:hypothetical protein M378DRAFT_10837 [Amanita muscaria Koide BX008]|uniref:Uncharacterized protein n=1 Tax=Amanita muscaria (strain Koide BX008) TaxID=946122 RepID=A0A0C2TF41_AMAMK|nr:hypothetical protein M378DRAFT_10837 [Amanita muscaria Koide BX008]
MKSFKVLTLLTLAAALSCGANGSPATNATTDGHGFIKRQNKDELIAVLKSLSDTASTVWNDKHGNMAEFTQAFVKALAVQNAHYNYVICQVTQVENTFQFDGKQWVDWAVSFVKTSNDMIKCVRASCMTSVPFADAQTSWEVVVGGAGTFIRRVEYGDENWAWEGKVAKGQDLNSARIKFVNRVTAGGPHQDGGD